jgi:hypothetical protein
MHPFPAIRENHYGHRRRSRGSARAELAQAIARRAGERSSGRVARSAAGKGLDERAVTLAMVASIRHLDTDYDDLLMSGIPREEARERIRAAIDSVLAA